MRAVTDREALDKAKATFIEAQKRIEDLRQKIAETACPLKVGDAVIIFEREREFRGVVEYVGYTLTQDEMLGPVMGAETGWSAGGHRIRKTTGQLGKSSFHITSFDARLDNGKWIVTRQSWLEKLGID